MAVSESGEILLLTGRVINHRNKLGMEALDPAVCIIF